MYLFGHSLHTDSRSLSKPRIRASSVEETSSSFEVTEIITDLKEKVKHKILM